MSGSPQPGAGRDRDAVGRPRNARARDQLGRPLARGGGPGVEPVPEQLDLEPDDAVALAQRYLDDGLPFHAHEVLEAAWKSRPATERDLWQGLAQLAVGLTHLLRGNVAGAGALLERGAGRLAGYRGDPHGVDLVGVQRYATELLGALRAGGGDRPESLRLRAPEPG